MYGGSTIGAFSFDPSGPYFLKDGQLWFYRGLTGFLLPKLLLTGDEDRARAYLQLAVDWECNVIRAFSQVNWDGVHLGVEPGFLASQYPRDVYDAALHRTFDLAASFGLSVEMVTHTFAASLDVMLEHSARVDRIAAQHGNAFLEDSNEPPVNRIPIEDICQRFQPTTLLACSGQYDPSPWPGRRYGNDHPPRDNQSCRKFKGGVEVQDGSGPFAPFSPPFYGPWLQDEPGRLEDTACWPSLDDLASFGAGVPFFNAGGTIHGGQWAQGCHPELVTDDLRARVAAYNRGFNTVPTQRYHGYQHPDDQGSLRRYRRRGDDGKTYEISVRPFGFGVV